MTETNSLIEYLRMSSAEPPPPIDLKKVAKSAAYHRRRKRISMMIGSCLFTGLMLGYFYGFHVKPTRNPNMNVFADPKKVFAPALRRQSDAPVPSKVVAPSAPTSTPSPTTTTAGVRTQVAARNKPPSTRRPIDHVAGAAFRIDACPTDLDDICLKKWQAATLRERPTLVEKRIVAAATKTERGAARARALLHDPLISQLFAHYQREPGGPVTASSRPLSRSMDIPLGFLRGQAEKTRSLAIYQPPPQVYAAAAETQLGRAEHFVVDMDNPLGMSWRKVNSLIVNSSAAKIENTTKKNLGAKYAVILTFRSNVDLFLDIPQGTILIGDSDYQPLVVTAIDPVKRENFTNEYSVMKRQGLWSWTVGIQAGREKSIRLEGHCLIESLASPDGVHYQFSGWKLRPSVLRDLGASSDKQEFVWKTTNAMLNVIAD
jgi:hypothetical protein